MKNLLSRGVVLAVALAIVPGPFGATGAEAGNHRYRHPGPPGHAYGRGSDRQVVVHHDHVYVDHHSCGYGVATFLGGVAVGAIVSHIGGYCPAPPPPPPPARRVWVYDCDACGFHCRDYGDWCDHLCGVHGVPRCDLAVGYPVNYCGHWEGW